MTTRRKLTLINGTTGKGGGIYTYRAKNSFEIGGCFPGRPSVPPVPFPDDDWDNFDPAE